MRWINGRACRAPGVSEKALQSACCGVFRFSCCGSWRVVAWGGGKAGPGAPRWGLPLLPGRGSSGTCCGACGCCAGCARATWHRCRPCAASGARQRTVRGGCCASRRRRFGTARTGCRRSWPPCRPPPTAWCCWMRKAASNGATRWQPTTLALTRSATSCSPSATCCATRNSRLTSPPRTSPAAWCWKGD